MLASTLDPLQDGGETLHPPFAKLASRHPPLHRLLAEQTAILKGQVYAAFSEANTHPDAARLSLAALHQQYSPAAAQSALQSLLSYAARRARPEHLQLQPGSARALDADKGGVTDGREPPGSLECFLDPQGAGAATAHARASSVPHTPTHAIAAGAYPSICCNHDMLNRLQAICNPISCAWRFNLRGNPVMAFMALHDVLCIAAICMKANET